MVSQTRHYCTYFDRNYLAKGLALIHSLERHERKDWVLHVVCLDELTRTILNRLGKANVVTVPIHELERGDTALVAPRETRSLVEYYWTLTPTIILRMLERLEPDSVLTYLDADLFFYSDPQPIFNELGSASVLIHEHRFSETQRSLSSNGHFNVGLLCFRHDPQGLEALRWWRERCIEWCFKRVENGKMGDQAYLNDWPQRFSGVVVLQHLGAGVGPWNHDSYRFTEGPDGKRTVAGVPLIFYHFHAFTVVRPEVIMPAGTAYSLTKELLKIVFAPYAEAVGEAVDAIRRLQRDFQFGVHEAHLNREQTVLAKATSALELEALGLPQKRSRLTEKWDVWASKQFVETEGDEAIDAARANVSRVAATSSVKRQAPARESVLAALDSHQVEGPLYVALAHAARALQSVFSPSELATARGILLGIVAHALDDGTEFAAVCEADSAPVGAEPDAHRIRLLTATIQRAADADDLDTADAALAELLVLLPSHADVQLTAGHLAVRRGNLRSAQDSFIRASILVEEGDPSAKHDIADAFIQLALNWEASQDAAMARLNAERALRLEPENAEARELCQRLTPSPVPVARRATAPSDPQPRMAERDALFDQGERLAAAGDWSRAYELFKMIAAEFPSFAPAQVGIASASFARGDVDAGLAALEHACALEPRDIGLHVHHGKLLLQTGKLTRASSAFQELVRRAPTNVDARLGLAEVHRLQGNALDAIDVLDAAHAAFPEEPAFIAAIGTLAAELGDHFGAAEALSALQAFAPQHPRTIALQSALAPSASMGA